MRLLILSTWLVAVAFVASTGAQQPAAPASAPRARPALTIEVTDTRGATVGDVLVLVSGTVSREGRTDQSGQLRFAGMRAGNYRLRFEREGFVTLERDITVAARTVTVDVNLTPAPAPKVEAAPPPPPPPAPVVRPPGEQKTTNVPVFVERNFISNREGKKESPIGCTGEATSMLIQLREPLAEHMHEAGAEMLYIVAGEAAHRVGGRDEILVAGSFSAVPRGTAHSLTRRGRNPVIIISTLAGEPCAGEGNTAGN